MDTRYLSNVPPCEHVLADDAQHPDMSNLFGPTTGLCRDCAETITLYNDVFAAMAGDVRSMARLAEAGYIPSIQPTIADLNRAGNTLFAEMSPNVRQLSEAETVRQLGQ